MGGCDGSQAGWWDDEVFSIVRFVPQVCALRP